MRILLILVAIIITGDLALADGRLYGVFASYFTGLNPMWPVLAYVGGLVGGILMIGIMLDNLRELPLPVVKIEFDDMGGEEDQEMATPEIQEGLSEPLHTQKAEGQD